MPVVGPLDEAGRPRVVSSGGVLYGGVAMTRRPWPVGWGACADRCTGFPAANPDRTRPDPAV